MLPKSFANSKKGYTFAIANGKQPKQTQGRLAQLVQSICLTSRGSAVRIRQRPPKESRLKIERFSTDFVLCRSCFLCEKTMLKCHISTSGAFWCCFSSLRDIRGR